MVNEQELDWAKITEMQKALDEVDEEKLKRALVFDVDDVLLKTKQTRELYDEDLGTIRYVLLTYDDLNEISDMKNPATKEPFSDRERSVQILVKQLTPANPNITAKKIRALPYEVVVRLLLKLQGEGSFFFKKPTQPQKKSRNG